MYLVYTIALTQKEIEGLFQWLFVAMTWVTTKIFILLYVFSHFIPYANYHLYRWVRDTGVGEITRVSLDNDFHRIFLQSQIHTLTLAFVLVMIVVGYVKKDTLRTFFKTRASLHVFVLLTLSIASVLISFSRSFWVGVLAGIALLFAWYVYHIVRKHIPLKVFLRATGVHSASVIAALLLILAITNFPFPAPGQFGLGDLKDRLDSSFQNEAAVSSRWNLLPVLREQISENLVFGQGFGTTVTYNSDDPRIKNEENPEGAYTTSTFEWGYLDTITEVGVVGLSVFLVMYVYVFILGIQKLQLLSQEPEKLLIQGLLIGLIVLATVHFFSPYFNHPLGIGVILIAVSTFRGVTQKQEVIPA
jgi:O-antigen ligase